MRMLLASALMAATAASAWAQVAPPAPAPQQPRPTGMARSCADLDAHYAARLAFAEVKVQPTDAQRAAWDQFGREARAALEPIKRLCADAATPPPADYAGRLALRETRMAAMLENTRAMRAAVDKLQPTLNDEQRTRFSDAMSRRGDWMGRQRGGDESHRHGHGRGQGQGGMMTPRGQN
ncbi:MAG: hypothetical protein FJX57_21355 [Alphaproteobacteria bacterium]|nr:hypothetical protein [Alphaproteobacteria bacterium]